MTTDSTARSDSALGGGDRDGPDELVQQWQQDQSEYFQATIVEIVTEYATWRERLASDREANKAGGLWYRRWFKAQARVNELEALLASPPKHKFWGPGEPDCPRDIKAPNGELHTLRCKACGLDNPRDDICPPPHRTISNIKDKSDGN